MVSLRRRRRGPSSAYAVRLRRGAHHRARRRASTCAARTVTVSGRGLLLQRRRRDLRPRAATAPGTSSPRRTRCSLPRVTCGRAERLTASRGGPPRRRPGTGCRRRARSSRSATRRRTVRRLRPSVRAICSSLAPAGELPQQERRARRRAAAAVEPGHGHRPLPSSSKSRVSASTSARWRTSSRGSSAKPSGSGSTAWVALITNIRVGIASRTRTCSPLVRRAPQHLGRLG